MWSEELNKKIQEGENLKQPGAPDSAWTGMESLLDKHLPHKQKRRRFIFWLLPALLGTGLATFYLLQRPGKPEQLTSQKNTPPAQVESEQPGSRSEKSPAATVPFEKNHAEKKIAVPGKTPIQPGTVVTEKNKTTESSIKEPGVVSKKQSSIKKEITLKKPASGERIKDTKPLTKDDRPGIVINEPVAPVNEKKTSIAKTKPGEESITPTTPEQQTTRNPLAVQPGVADSSASALASNEEKKPADSLSNEQTEQKKPVLQKKGSFGDKFSLNLSFGPDISAVGVDNPGRVQFQYGVGVAYAVTKNLIIRTGFYAGDKKYTADSADYHLSYTIPNLEKVEADCYVYEIPLNIVYQFNPVKKHSWFVSGGVSSYIMKRETYGYYYKNPWGQPQYYDRTYKNENEHLFSVIGLSGGYQYMISNKLSLIAEPYIKFPVRGIGAGKVKLNNTGILFTIGYKPFSKNK